MTWTNAFVLGECAVEVLLLNGGGGSIFLQTMAAGDNASFSYGGVSYTVDVDVDGVVSIDMGVEDNAPANLCVLVEPAYDTSELVYQVAGMHSAYAENLARGLGSDVSVAADSSGACTPDPVTSDSTSAVHVGMIGASGYGNPRPLLSFGVEFGDAPAPPVVYNCDCDDTTGNRTLKQLRDDLMRRLGFGAQVNNPPPGMADLLNSFLVQAQEFLYRRYDVLRTERFYSWQLQTGVRMYDIDANDETCTKRLDPRKVTWVGVIRDDQWLPLICGIPPTLYSGNQTGWPQRYEIRQCIEVWPVPDETAGSLVVKGHFGLEAFAADADKTTIDDQLVFALALANAKSHYRQPDANNYIAQMEAMMRNLVAGSHHTRRYVPGDDGRSDYIYTRPKPSEPFPT